MEKGQVTIRAETEKITEHIFWFPNNSIVVMEGWWYNCK